VDIRAAEVYTWIMKNAMSLEAVRAAVEALKVEDVKSVYSGKAGKCACGCAGSHRSASAHRDSVGADRGYPVKDDEVNDRQVRKVVSVLKANADVVDVADGNMAAEVDGRLYVVYL